ncbi:hypothetical protein SAMN05216553_102115 [Lentzea fradiae]|uniref:Uncharacterized protein n=1 Tax=Lentzea fradiae TaxID=200378 RepID=A0A1G7M5P3_9PSEU|nr:hypothetical protein [Lentzea fradiae]SDF57088.1 hypothetical protein SAMN05216553_102115 [Lentzea fradiae]
MDPDNETGEVPAAAPGEAPDAHRQEDVAEPLVDDQEDEDLDEASAAERSRGNQVINNFYAEVDAANARFGVSVSASTRRATGPISRAEIDAVRQDYVRPGCFDEFERLLRAEHLAVAVGVDGIGKRTGAIAGLCSVLPEGSPVVALAPSSDFAELRIAPGRGYLMADRLDSGAASVQQRFEIERVQAELARNGSYMVITLGSPGALRRHLRRFVVDWQPPDSELLFDRYFGDVPDGDADLALVRKRIADQPPRTVVAVAGTAARQGGAAALAELTSSSAQMVRDWFDEDRRTLSEVLSAAAALFAYGVPVRKFEVLLERLLELGASGGNEMVGPQMRALDSPPPQRRVDWANDGTLFTVTRDLSAEFGDPGRERRIVFRFPNHREHVAAELAERFGIEVWAPVRTWAHEVVKTPVSEVHLQLALGLALLGRDSWGEVEESFLMPWSNGTGPERVATAYVLSWMCIDDSLAPVALDLVLRWVRDSRIKRRTTAANALGGALGIRYQLPALTWLWHLASRGGIESRVARQSIAALFCANAGDGADAGSLLRFVQRGLDTAVDDGRPMPALDTVVAVLGATRPDSGETAMAGVLREQPQNLRVVGELWAETVRSARHRGRGIDALRRTLTALGEDEVAKTVIVRLGEVVRVCLTDTETEILRRSLGQELGGPAGGAGIAEQIVSALLATFATGSDW